MERWGGGDFKFVLLVPFLVEIWSVVSLAGKQDWFQFTSLNFWLSSTWHYASHKNYTFPFCCSCFVPHKEKENFWNFSTSDNGRTCKWAGIIETTGRKWTGSNRRRRRQITNKGGHWMKWHEERGAKEWVVLCSQLKVKFCTIALFARRSEFKLIFNCSSDASIITELHFAPRKHLIRCNGRRSRAHDWIDLELNAIAHPHTYSYNR